MSETIDVLMITHRRPDYLRMSLPRLLETCDQNMRVWLWHNGDDSETLEVVHDYASDPRVHKFHHSTENLGLTPPTNWLWSNTDAQYVAKVDDDCLVEGGWARTLAKAQSDHEKFGVLALWHFQPEDFHPELAKPKIAVFPGGHQILQNFWVQGSGYLMKGSCIRDQGLLRPGQSFTGYCIELALSGYINGWYYPLVLVEHLDDPRSPNSGLRSDEDLRRSAPLSVARTGATTLEEWESQLKRSAWEVQSASIDPRHYRGWRKRLRNFFRLTPASRKRSRSRSRNHVSNTR